MSTSAGPGWKYCGDCGRQMRVTQAQCELCGWHDPNAGKVGTGDGDHDRCAYEFNGARCPLPGVFSPAVTGKGATLWCWVHAGERHYDAAAARELQEIIEQPQRYVRPGITQEVDARLAEIIADNPQWARNDEEARSEYVKRIGAIARGQLSALVRRQRRVKPNAGGEGGNVEARPAEASPSAPAPSREELVEDAMEQGDELAAKLEEQGYATEVAQRMAFQYVLMERTRTWAGRQA